MSYILEHFETGNFAKSKLGWDTNNIHPQPFKDRMGSCYNQSAIPFIFSQHGNMNFYVYMSEIFYFGHTGYKASHFTRRKEGDKSRLYVLPTRRCGTDCVMFFITQLDIHKTVSPAASGQQLVTTTFISLLPPSDLVIAFR